MHLRRVANCLAGSAASSANNLQETGSASSFRYLIIGRDFQNRVWKALMDIPYGNATSYSQIRRDRHANGRTRCRRGLFLEPFAHCGALSGVLRDEGGLGGFAVGLAPKR